MALTDEERASLARQLEEALEMEAKGIKPYVPDILFTEGIFKDREEYDEWVRTAPVYSYEEYRHKPLPKPARPKKDRGAV